MQNDRMDKVRSVCVVCECVCLCMCGSLRHVFLSLVLQSAGTFEDVEKPSSAYQKTKPVEAGKEPSAVCTLTDQRIQTPV